MNEKYWKIPKVTDYRCVEDLQPPQKIWISIKEALPNKSGKYWVHVKKFFHRGSYSDYQALYYSFEENVFQKEFYTDEVLHWMPILEAPEGEG